jgi:hypothetical protein
MLKEIVTHTPHYVWLILALLVYRGILASQAREVTIRKLCIIPVVMLGLSLQGIQNAFGLDGLPPLIWLGGALAGATLAWRLSYPTALRADPARGVISQPGSWVPLALMLSVFLMKYAVAVLMAMAPALRHEAVFIAVVCVLYGGFSGIFVGRLLRCLAVYYRTGMQGDAMQSI